MIKIFLRIVLGVAVLFTTGCYHKKFTNRCYNKVEKLGNELEKIFESPEFYNANWGVVVQSLESGEYLYLKNENKNVMPASNVKLFTTAVALLRLKPDFRFHTRVYNDGQISDEGVIHGNLIVTGSGDPSFSSRYHDGNMYGVFEAWADSLQQLGIREINGDIIGDDNYFDEEIMGDGWAWDYQSDWYAAQISAISFNDNCMDILLAPGDSIGAPANIRLEPETDFVHVINNVKTVREKIPNEFFYNRRRGTNEVVVSGSIAIDSNEKRDWFSIENPTSFTMTVFKDVLEQRGIVVSGLPRDIDDIDTLGFNEKKRNELFCYKSPPLWKIVNTINKVSQNLYAELVLRTLGAEIKGCGNAATGIEVIRETIKNMGIDPDGFTMVDGSGLSRLNLMTPRQIAQLLSYMYDSPLYKFYFNSLPTAGVDGSLKHRMKNTSARGKVIAKTGYLGNTVALSGFVKTRDEEECVFSFIVNNYTVPTSMAHKIQDMACERLTNFSRN